MQVLTGENIFKSSYFKDICPGYEQFFEPEKLFSRMTDDAIELKRRQDILRDLLDNPKLFEDLCFLSGAIIQFKSAFDDLSNHDLGDFRLNLECFEDADGAVGLLDRFLKTADYSQQFSWLNGFAEGVAKLIQKRSAEKIVAAWNQAFVTEALMHACDFGFSFDDILWPVNYKLLAVHESPYSKKSTTYRIESIKKKLLGRFQESMTNTDLMGRTGQNFSFGNGNPFFKMSDQLSTGDTFIFDEDAVTERAKTEKASERLSIEHAYAINNSEYKEDYLLKSIACGLLECSSVTDAPAKIKFFITSLISELEPLVTEFVPYLCAAKTALYWRDKGIPYCIPEIGKPSEIHIQGLINPYIAKNEGIESIIDNDVNLNGDIALVTGANRGGKTAFVTAVTLCQLLFQLGFPIPATSAKLSVFSGIVTVFAGEEQGLIGMGRLGEELKKLAAALNAAQTENTFICFNEPLTGTSSRDGERILCEALCILKQAGASGFVVTHLLGLTRALDVLNKIAGTSLITLTAQTDGDKPLYKIIPAPVADTSHAKAVVSRFISK